MAEHPRIVVVGAGFGGLQAAQSLAGAAADVLLIDRNSYHTFVPLLYQVATAQLAPEQIMYPVRTILRRSPNLQFLRATVRRVDLPLSPMTTLFWRRGVRRDLQECRGQKSMVLRWGVWMRLWRSATIY